jgi:hypothetical protein
MSRKATSTPLAANARRVAPPDTTGNWLRPLSLPTSLPNRWGYGHSEFYHSWRAGAKGG